MKLESPSLTASGAAVKPVRAEALVATPGRSGSEPTKQDLDELVNKCREKNARVLAVEPQFSPQAAETVLKELRRDNHIPDAATVEIDPLETCRPDELDAGWYERKMRQNLEALAKAMK